MLSILVDDLFLQEKVILEDNIHKTIGNIKFEIIYASEQGILQDNYPRILARMISKARFPFLCFIKSHFLFKTYNWGNYIIGLLNEDKIGAIGNSGTTYLPRTPGCWWGVQSGTSFPVIRENRYSYNLYDELCELYTNLQEELTEVVALDGFFCCKKMNLVSFNIPCSYRSSHFLILEFSQYFRMNQLRLLFSSKILIEEEKCDIDYSSWLNDCRIFFNRHYKNLPTSSCEYKKKQITFMNRHHNRLMLSLLENNKSWRSFYTIKEFIQLFLIHPFYTFKQVIKYNWL